METSAICVGVPLLLYIGLRLPQILALELAHALFILVNCKRINKHKLMNDLFKKKFEKYKIKPNDTLSSISAYFEIEKDVLRNFHNIYASREETIILNLPETLDYIYVDPRYEEKVNAHKTKVKLDSGQVLVFEPQKKLDTYTVEYIFTEEDKVSQEQTTLSFEITVAYIKQTTAGFLFEFDKKPNYFVNNEEANSFSEELALRSIQCLYPLQIYVDPTGKWTTVANHDSILKRWVAHKKSITEYYQEEWCEEYIQEMENTIASPRLLYDALQQDLFLNTFFSGIYINYYNDLQAPKTDCIPFIPHCSPVLYSGQISLSKYLDEFEKGSVVFEATLTDSRSATDFENQCDFPQYEDDEKTKGNVYFKYVLDKKNQIEGIYKKCILELSKKQRIEIIITKQ